MTTAAAVPLSTPESFGGQIGARITSVDRTTAKARIPGEIAGPAVAVHVLIDNASSRPISVGAVTVNVTDAAGTPSSPLTDEPNAPFSGTLAAGKQASATYLFSLAAGHRNPVTVSVSYSNTAPVLLFTGTIS